MGIVAPGERKKSSFSLLCSYWHVFKLTYTDS